MLRQTAQSLIESLKKVFKITVRCRNFVEVVIPVNNFSLNDSYRSTSMRYVYLALHAALVYPIEEDFRNKTSNVPYVKK